MTIMMTTIVIIEGETEGFLDPCLTGKISASIR
jgi:hypothetical protein